MCIDNSLIGSERSQRIIFCDGGTDRSVTSARPNRVAGADHSELEIQVVMSDAMMEPPRHVTRHGPAVEIVAQPGLPVTQS